MFKILKKFAQGSWTQLGIRGFAKNKIFFPKNWLKTESGIDWGQIEVRVGCRGLCRVSRVTQH